MPVLTTAKGRHEVFCNEYIVDLNGTQAAIRTGYAAKSAKVTASRLLTNAAVQARIEELKAARIERTQFDADWVLQRLAEELTADFADLYTETGQLRPIREWPLIWRQGLVGGMEVISAGDDLPVEIQKIKVSDRTPRLKMLGEHIKVQAFKQQIGLEDTTETHEQWLQKQLEKRTATG